MPWGAALAAAATAAASIHGARKQRIAMLRAQGKDEEADALERAFSDHLAGMANSQRTYNPEDLRNSYRYTPRIRVHLPIPELLRERPWWPWLALEMWLQLWVTVV